jgi:hypothetical protein
VLSLKVQALINTPRSSPPDSADGKSNQDKYGNGCGLC